MASIDTYFKVKTGLGVGTEALYADALTKSVAIGATQADYTLDVYGTIYGDADVLVDNNVGIGTTIPVQRLDVKGVGIFSGGVGIGTTNPEQLFQVNPSSQNPVVVTGLGSIGINNLNPIQPLQISGETVESVFVVTGLSSIGIRTDNPLYDLHYITRQGDYNIVINEFGKIGVNNLFPDFNIDILGDIKVSGFATITNAYVGVATIGLASITEEIVGFSTVGFATIENSYTGVATVGLASIFNEIVGFSTVGFATIENSYTGVATVGLASIFNEIVGFSTVGFATIENSYTGVATVGLASIFNEIVGFSTVGFATIENSYTGVATVGLASIFNEIVGFSTVGLATIENAYVGVATIGFASITNEIVGISTIGFATITNAYIGVATIGLASITNEIVGFSTVGFATIENSYTGVATIGLASITNEIVGFSTVGFATIENSYTGVATVGLASIFNEIVGISTIGFATITNAYVGVATIGLASITNEIVGISTIGFATITNAYVGVATIGLASITNEIVGFSTIGFATITDAYIGVATIGLASITNEIVGFSTVGISTIENSYIGVATVGFATISDSYLGFTTVGVASIGREEVLDSEIENLLVTGITTTAKLDVGIGATLLRARSFDVTTIENLENETIKKIQPIVGIGTTLPTRTLDISGDLRIRGEVIDSNNNVGYANSVLSSSGAIGISGRFIDGANLLIRNKEFIAEEIVGFITSTDGPFGANGTLFDYGPIGVGTGREKCKRDIGLIIDAIAFDITKGGNSKSVGAGVSYSSGIDYLSSSPQLEATLGEGYVKTATIVGITSIAVLSRYVINNSPIPTSYQPPVPGGKYNDAARLILRNKKLIAEVAVGRMLDYFEGFSVPGGSQNCIDDVISVLEAICYNLDLGGNNKVYDAAELYLNNDYLSGEEVQSIYAFEQARDLAIQVMRNQSVNVGSYSSEIQLFDFEIIGDISGRPGIYDQNNLDCTDVAASLFTFFEIITNAIDTPATLPETKTFPASRVSQYIDLEVIADGDSNQNPNGCANVLSAIYSAVGIVTTIIGAGSLEASGIKLNNPSGQLVWTPPGPKIGNEWFVNKLGDDNNGGTGPGDAFLTIKKAASVAQPGDTIKVFAGLYIEDGPIVLNERVAVIGEDLRRVLVTTRDKTDLFYVKRGCYVAMMSFVGESNPGKAMVSFPTRGFGYADGTEQNWQSPYVQNCTNFVPDSIGMRIDGDRAGGFKSMVLDAYTQYNQGGIGVNIYNFGYAQLVSLFTICCDIAVYNDTGGVCDLNNSNTSFGNYGLWANGATPLQYTGTVVQAPTGENIDSLVVNVGAGASTEFKDAVDILRANKDYIASEVVGFITSTSSDQIFPGVVAPFPGIGDTFDYGGSPKGRDFCRRDTKIIIEQICSDILTLGNKNSIDAGMAYRDSDDDLITYLDESNPRPVGFNPGYVKDAEIAAIKFIAGISTYIVRNQPVPFTYQSGIGTFPQVFLSGITTSSRIDQFISSRAGIITSIIGIGKTATPPIELPKGQRPYDGQIAIIDTQYYFVSRIQITNPGRGYDPTIPVEVTIDFPPENDQFFIPAEAAIFETGINPVDGSITTVDVLVSGTGYRSTPPNVTIAPPPAGPGNVQATAVAVMDKLFFNPIAATPVSVGGTTTVTFDEFITYSPLISVGSTVYFYQSSKIIASSITFEYVGTGINIVNAIPSKGAVPIDENQILATNGGKVPFTSTDQSGDFRISEGITINQNTGTISGQAFSKSLQAEVTPLIIALQS